MTLYRTLLFAALIVATPLRASAQIGVVQGELPGGPWTLPPPAQPSAPPPACRQLLALRDETQKHGMAIQKANERRASVQEACKLFKTFLAAEAQFIRSLEDNSRTCGVTPDAMKQAKEGHAKAGQVGKQVCDAAARPRLTGSDPWEALREGSHDQSGDDNCNICWKTDDSWWWLDKRNPLPGPR